MASDRIGPALGRRFLLVVLLVVVVPLGAGALWATRSAARSGRALLRSQLDAQLDGEVRDVAASWQRLRADLLTLGENEPVRLLLRDTSDVETSPPAFVSRAFGDMTAFEQVVVMNRRGHVRLKLATATAPSRAESRAAAVSYRGIPVHIPVTDLVMGDTIGSIDAIVRVVALVPAIGRVVNVSGPLLMITTSSGAVVVPYMVDARIFENEQVRWESGQWTTVRRQLAEPTMELALAGALSPYEAPFEQAASRSALALLAMSGFVVIAVVLLTRRLSRDVEREFAQREALATVGEFASELAHEVRNPLTAMRLDVQRAQERVDDADTLSVLSRVLGQIDRLDRAVSGALRVTRGPSVEPHRVDLRHVLEAACRSADPEFARRGARLVRLGGSGATLSIDGDAGALEQLFLNLLINAAQALSPGGEAHVRAANENGSVTVSIRDTGAGMNATQLSEIEQPYRSSRRDGVGLGLKIARRIARNHGGELRIESAPGEGTTVFVRLPL